MGCGCGKNKASQKLAPQALNVSDNTDKTKIVKVVNGKKYTYYV